MSTTKTFAEKLVCWQKISVRHDLPWQKTKDPYLRWVSEIMLQQTQVSAVIPYYEAFIRDFPTVEALAAASDEDVLRHWSGLGYYSRARNLHAGAKKVVAMGGAVPQDLERLMAIPGIGRSTAGAILSSCWNEPVPILDGNAKRLLARCFAVKRGTSEAAFSKVLWAVAQREMPKKECAVYTQALMDMGSMICTRSRPRCETCPVAGDCLARQSGDPASYPGSVRKRQAKREESAVFLAILGSRGLWLEERTGEAVWKGLWCFPQYRGDMAEADLKSLFAKGKGIDVESLCKEMELRHDFTHYRLLMHIWSVNGEFENLKGGRWFSAEDVATGALPSPVKRAALEILSSKRRSQPALR